MIPHAKREKPTGAWTELHNQELHNLYSSPNFIRVIKYRRIRRSGCASPQGEMRNAYILVEISEGNRSFRSVME
jgi:hypothetical protein